MRKIYILIFCLSLFGCVRDEIDEGVVTNISGTISDDWNNIPFVDLKVKVGEYKIDAAGGMYVTYEFIQWIDSTYTDANGYYELDFETSGQGNYYSLSVEEDVDVWTYYYDPIEIESIGKTNSQDLDFLHLYPINLEIELSDLDFFPVEIDVETFSDLPGIESGNGAFERILYANKNADTKINFRRLNANNEYEIYEVIIPASNTSELSSFSITINNSDFN